VFVDLAKRFQEPTGVGYTRIIKLAARRWRPRADEA